MTTSLHGTPGTETLAQFCQQFGHEGKSNRFLILIMGIGLLCLTGCSGCQQSPEKKSTSATTETESPKTEEAGKSELTGAAEPDRPASIVADASSAEVPSQSEHSGSANVPGKTDPSATNSVKKSGSASGKPTSPEAALAAAQALRDQARRAADRKDFGKAFDLASQAWDAARTFPKDSRLSNLSEELAIELEKFGEQANSKSTSRANDPGTTLIEK